MKYLKKSIVFLSTLMLIVFQAKVTNLENSSLTVNNKKTTLYSPSAESLASTDEVLDSYSPYNTELDANGKWRDNDIVKLIPKSYFSTPGIFSFIGKEFCYILNTSNYNHAFGYSYETFVYVYDIDVKMPGFDEKGKDSSSQVVIRIFPVIKQLYRLCMPGDIAENWEDRVSPGLTSVVSAFSNSLADYYIKNFNFYVNVKNANNPNVGDLYYDIDQDDGDYITETRYSFNGYTKKESTDFLLKTVQFVFDVVPIPNEIGNIYAALNYMTEIHSKPLIEYSLNYESFITTYSSSIEDHKKKYGGLLKTAVVIPDGQGDGATKPFLLGTDKNHYVESRVALNSASNRGASEEQILTIGISMDFMKDKNTFLSHVEKLQVYGNYQRNQEYLDLYKPKDCIVNKSSETIYNKFIPEKTGLYEIGTSRTLGTSFKVYDQSGSVYSSYPSYSLSTDINSLAYYLEEGKTYYIKSKSSNVSNALFSLHARYATSGVFSLNTSTEVLFVDTSGSHNDFVVYLFTPSTTKKYLIESTNNSEVGINVFDMANNKISATYNTTGKTKCTVSLVAGKKYMIKITATSNIDKARFYISPTC